MDSRDLMYSLGGPIDAFQAIDAQRSGLRNVPEFSSFTPQDASGFDRYTQMAQYGENFGPNASFLMRALSPIAGGLGVGMLAGNEASKAIPGAQDLLYNITGDPSFIPNKTSSKPSWSNFMSGLGGLLEGMTPGLLR